MALLSAAFGVLMLLTVLLASVAGFEFARKGVDSRTSIGIQEEFVAHSVIGVTIEQLWSDFTQAHSPESSGVDDFRTWLDSRGVASGSTQQLQVEDIVGRMDVSGAQVLGIELTRLDDGAETRIIVEVEVRSLREDGVGTETSVELPGTRLRTAWSIQGEGWDGASFALLTRNLSCAVCHMHVDNAQRFYNDDPSLYGTFDITKVGALHSFRPRDKTESFIAGKLYVGRTARTEKGKDIDWSQLGLELASFREDGKLVQNSWGDLSWSGPVPVSAAPNVDEANVHLDYASGLGEGEGGMPTDFPPVFVDEGDDVTGAGAGDHIVQMAEYEKLLKEMSGSVTGGTITVFAHGEVVDTAAERAAMFTGTASLGTSTIGNVTLSGTADHPLVIDGDIAIYGDLVLRGTVRGKGSIKATGNVYIVDNVEYLDGTTPRGNRSFGVGPDGSSNCLRIAAGGNIMVGDFIRADKHGGRNLGDTSGPYSFIANELASFNKEEWLRAQPRLPREGESVLDRSTWTADNPHYAGEEYVARYYSLSDGEPIPLLIGDGYYDPDLDDWIGPKDAKEWDDKGLLLAAPGTALVAGATVKPMFPSDWIDPNQLDELFLEIRQERIDAGR
jgi:hypothetical protein